MYDFFYGPTVPEINYSILFYSIQRSVCLRLRRDDLDELTFCFYFYKYSPRSDAIYICL